MPHLTLACLTLEEELPNLTVEGLDYEADSNSILSDEEVAKVNAHLQDLTSIRQPKS